MSTIVEFVSVLILGVFAVGSFIFFASIEDSFARVRAGIILALLVWIVGLGMHSLDKRFIEKKCKIAYELNDKGKRGLVKEIVQHNNAANLLFFGLSKIDPENYPDLFPATETDSSETKEKLKNTKTKSIKLDEEKFNELMEKLKMERLKE